MFKGISPRPLPLTFIFNFDVLPSHLPSQLCILIDSENLRITFFFCNDNKDENVKRKLQLLFTCCLDNKNKQS